MLVKNKAFWIATLIFLAVGGGIGWFVFPSIYHSYQNQRAQAAQLDDQITTENQYIATVKSMTKQQATIDSLYQTASTLLPTTTQSDILALQLDGLTTSLGLKGLTITVPFASSSNQPAVQAGTAGSGPANQSFTLAGPASFAQFDSLIAALRTFDRWNKINSLEITQSGTTTNITIGSAVFNRSTTPAAFTGSNTNLLTQAATLFNQFKSYTTAPNIATEGQYGRADPFAAAK